MAGRGTDIKLGKGVPEIGGLAVIGSERHESRRIDNQLRGRSGRQGDPGYSEDDGYDHYHHRNRQQGRRGYLRSGQGGDGCSPVPHQEHRGAARGRRCI